MRWYHKAIIMKLCAWVPGGGAIVQGDSEEVRAGEGEPHGTAAGAGEMGKWALESGREIAGRWFFEVGTGHVPVAPIGWFLCGAGPGSRRETFATTNRPKTASC